VDRSEKTARLVSDSHAGRGPILEGDSAENHLEPFMGLILSHLDTETWEMMEYRVEVQRREEIGTSLKRQGLNARYVTFTQSH